MKANRRYIVGAFPGFLVQGLNVFENVLEFNVAGLEFVSRQSVEHESVVGVRRMSDADNCGFNCFRHISLTHKCSGQMRLAGVLHLQPLPPIDLQAMVAALSTRL